MSVISLRGVSIHLNPVAPRKAKIVYNFGLFECNRVNLAWLQISQTFVGKNNLAEAVINNSVLHIIMKCKDSFYNLHTHICDI